MLQVPCTEQTPSDKIHNWGGEPGCVSEAAAKGRLMVRLNDKQATIAVEGIELEVEPLFPKATSNTKLERWQLVHFDKELDLKSVAESIAALEDVERVEFDLKMKRIASEALPMPTSRPEPTRSGKLCVLTNEHKLVDTVRTQMGTCRH